MRKRGAGERGRKESAVLSYTHKTQRKQRAPRPHLERFRDEIRRGVLLELSYFLFWWRGRVRVLCVRLVVMGEGMKPPFAPRALHHTRLDLAHNS